MLILTDWYYKINNKKHFYLIKVDYFLDIIYNKLDLSNNIKIGVNIYDNFRIY